MPTHSSSPLYPDAKTQIQSHLFALAALATKEMDGIRVPGTEQNVCASRHKALGILEYESTLSGQPPLPRSLRDGLATVFSSAAMAPQSDMDYILALRGLALLGPKMATLFPSADLTALTHNFLKGNRLTDIELGIFAAPIHDTVCDKLFTLKDEVSSARCSAIEITLRTYLDLWPSVAKTRPASPLHPVFYDIVQRDLDTIRQANSGTDLKPPRGW